jgi:hypothetical protein
MRRLVSSGLTFLALGLLLAASATAGDYGKKDLLGSWDGDVMEMMKASGMMEQLPEGFDVSAMLASFSIQLTFDKDGTVTFSQKGMGREESDTDHFEVLGAEDNVLTLQSVDEDGTKETVTITFSDKDHFSMMVDEEGAMPMTFTRGAKKAKAE